MELWSAAVIFCLICAGITALALFCRRKGKRKRVIAVIAVSSLILLAVAVYILLSIILIIALQEHTG